MAAIGQWVLRVFAGKLGILVKLLFAKAASALFADILDPKTQKVAYEFVKELNQRDDIDNKEKAKIFNEKMLEFAKKEGKKMRDSVLNFLREWAVNSIKAEKLEAAQK